MKISEIILESSYQLNEHLGNLSKLNLGWMAGVFNQAHSSAPGRRGYSRVTNPRNSFQNYNLGSNSEIIDLPLKKNTDLFKSLRKSLKEHEGAIGFAVYINDIAVLVATMDYSDLRKPSSVGVSAYDLRPWQEIVDRIYEKEIESLPAYRYKPEKIKPTSQSIGKKGYDSDAPDITLAGKLTSPAELNKILEIIESISNETSSVVSFKLIMTDTKMHDIRNQRYRRGKPGDILEVGEDISTRLKKYKNSKKPTVDNVREFIELALRKETGTVQFAGSAYTLKPTSMSSALDPIKLMKGHSFTIYYQSVDPGSYNSISLEYAYNPTTRQIDVIQATYYDKTSEKASSVTEIINSDAWIAKNFRNLDIDDETAVMKTILSDIKQRGSVSSNIRLLIQALEKSGRNYEDLQAVKNLK